MEKISFFDRYMKIILLLPLIIFLLALLFFPTAYSWYLSFRDATLADYFNSTFNGLSNYYEVITEEEFWQAIFFSGKYATIVTVIELILGFLIALFFNHNIPGKTVLISLFLLPMMISRALLGTIFRLLLHESVGIITYLFGGLSLLIPKYIIEVVILIDVLQWTSFMFLIIYSGLQTIPQELYEASSIDGASYIQKVYHIVIPAVIPFALIAFILRWLESFNIFDKIFVLTGGGPGDMTTSLSIFIYKMAFQSGDVGQATAASLLTLIGLSIPLTILIRKMR